MNIEALKCVDMSCVNKIPYKNEIINAKLKAVTDGDTIKVVILLGDVYPLEVSIRILGIDTPESSLRPGVSEIEKKAGKLVKEYVKSLFVVGEVYKVILKDLDKYSGRYLGDIFVNTVALSAIVLENKLGREYHGEAKPAWDTEILETIIKKLE